jgi:hypothetical protein
MSKSPRSPKSPKTGGWGDWKPSSKLTIKEMQDLLGNKLPSSAKLRKDIVKVYDSERAKHGKGEKTGGCGCSMRHKEGEEQAYGKKGKEIRKGGCGCALKHREGEEEEEEEEAHGKGVRKGGCMDEEAFGKRSQSAKGLSRKTNIDNLIKQISSYDFGDATLNIDIMIPTKDSFVEKKEETTVHIGESYQKNLEGEPEGNISIKVVSTSPDLIAAIYDKIKFLLK